MSVLERSHLEGSSGPELEEQEREKQVIDGKHSQSFMNQIEFP